MRGLYIHIPFCVRKCSYCDFYSLLAQTDKIESYIHALLKEANAYSPSFVRRDLKGELYQQKSCFDTLYIGGGTPSLLGPQNLTTLITSLNNTLPRPPPIVIARVLKQSQGGRTILQEMAKYFRPQMKCMTAQTQQLRLKTNQPLSFIRRD